MDLDGHLDVRTWSTMLARWIFIQVDHQSLLWPANDSFIVPYTDYTVVPIYGVYIVPYFWEWKHDPTLWLPVIYATLLLKSGLVASSAAVLCQGFAHSDLDRRLETTLASLPWKTHRFKMFCTERCICFPLFPMSHVLSLHGHMCFPLNMSWVVLTAS